MPVPEYKQSYDKGLTLKAPITTATDDIHFSEKIRLDVSSESSARQRIQDQALFLRK